MKKSIGVGIFLFLVGVISYLFAQWDMGNPVMKGYSVLTSVVNVSSSTAATLLSARATRDDVLIYNSSTVNSVYIASYTAVTGDNNTDSGGYEIPATAWWSPEGKFTGVIYGKGPAGASGTTNVIKVVEFIGK